MMRSLSVGIFVLMLQACVLMQSTPLPLTTESADCERFFRQMDQYVDQYDVADAGAARITGFPELRVDRFLASFADEYLQGNRYTESIDRLRKLDEKARLVEWRNLPRHALTELQSTFGADVETKVKTCGNILAKQDAQSAPRRSHLLAVIESPEAYSTWQRILGLYFLTRWAIVEGIWRGQREMREPFLTVKENPANETRRIRYAPPISSVLGSAEVAKILEQSADNPLGIPEPSQDQLKRLFASFAPIWAVELQSKSDLIGSVRIDGEGETNIDTQNPVVYRLPSYTRYAGRVLLQLNYVIWFPDRPAQGWMDIYSGRFDGLIWRVTLGTDGKALAYDSIHTCGCYYQIFPGEGVRIAQPQDSSEPILSPTPILGLRQGERLMVELASGTHFIRAVKSEGPAADSEVYAWHDYDELRSLPMPNGRHRSMFDINGLVPGSERLERFLLWPMGVPSAGAMRQWGTHTIAFLGKRYFDDPRLMEKLIRPLWE